MQAFREAEKERKRALKEAKKRLKEELSTEGASENPTSPDESQSRPSTSVAAGPAKKRRRKSGGSSSVSSNSTCGRNTQRAQTAPIQGVKTEEAACSDARGAEDEKYCELESKPDVSTASVKPRRRS